MRLAPVIFIAAPLALLLAAHAQDAPRGLAPAIAATIVAEPLSELSGLVRSRRHPGVYWAHNDSGDSARLFAIDAEGRSVLPTYSRLSQYGDQPEPGKSQWQGFEVLQATNVDWEDIAVDGRYLYIADVGNNGNDRRDLVIYAVSEIDPTASTRSAVVQRLPVVYPHQRDFPDPAWDVDSESLFVADDTLYLITKHRASSLGHPLEAGARLYRLDTRHQDADNVLVPVDEHPGITSATGADLSPDGSRLAVVSYRDLWLFERPDDGSDRWLSSRSTRIPLDPRTLRQVEAVTWMDDHVVLLGNEQRELFRVDVDALPTGPHR